MRVNTKPRRKNAPRPAEKSAPGFLQWLRGRECLAAPTSILPCYGKIEAAHVDYAGDKGMGTKVSDRFSIPLCSEHHYHQHMIGWLAFDRHHLKGDRSALLSAEGYWRAWPGRIAWERKLEANDG